MSSLWQGCYCSPADIVCSHEGPLAVDTSSLRLTRSWHDGRTGKEWIKMYSTDNSYNTSNGKTAYKMQDLGRWGRGEQRNLLKQVRYWRCRDRYPHTWAAMPVIIATIILKLKIGAHSFQAPHIMCYLNWTCRQTAHGKGCQPRRDETIDQQVTQPLLVINNLHLSLIAHWMPCAGTDILRTRVNSTTWRWVGRRVLMYMWISTNNNNTDNNHRNKIKQEEEEPHQP